MPKQLPDHDLWKLATPPEPVFVYWNSGSANEPMPEYLRDDGDRADEAYELASLYDGLPSQRDDSDLYPDEKRTIQLFNDGDRADDDGEDGDDA